MSSTYYVDYTNGNDANAGTEAAPFKTLEAARDAIRVLQGDGSLAGSVVASYALSDATDQKASYDLTAYGSPSFVSGKLTKCVHLSASTPTTLYRTAGDSTVFKPSGSMSCAMWIKPDNTTDGTQRLVNLWDTSGKYSWLVKYVGNTGVIQWFTSSDGTTYNLQTLDAGTPSSSKWLFIGVVYDDSSHTKYIYCGFEDETALSSDSTSWTGPIGGSGAQFKLSGYWTGSTYSEAYNGYIDSVHYWNSALSSADMGTLFNGGHGMAYPFPDGGGTNLPAGGVTVYLRGGTHRRTSALFLGIQDGSSSSKPIVYRGYPGETVVVSGGEVLTETWTSLGGSKYSTPVDFSFRSLFADNTRLTRARYPETGWSRIKSVDAGGETNSFHFNGTDIDASWTNLQKVEVVSCRRWYQSRQQISSVSGDEVTLQGNLKSDRAYDWDYDVTKSRYFCDNVYEGLTANDMWYLNTSTSTLYYKGSDPTARTFVAPRTTQLVDIYAADYTEFHDITFADTDWDYDEPVYQGEQAAAETPTEPMIGVDMATGVVLDRCTLCRGGGYAVHCYGVGVAVTRCVIYDMDGGVRFADFSTAGDTDDALNHDNSVVGCTIHDLGQNYYEANGILVQFASNIKLSNNLIYNVPHSAIAVGWKWDATQTNCHDNTIQFNIIHDAMQTLVDGAGVYVVGRQDNTVVQYNTIYDTVIDPAGDWYVVKDGDYHGVRALYFDAGASYITMKGNLVHDCSAGLQLYASTCSNNTIEHNMFVDCDRRVFEYGVYDNVATNVRYNVIYNDAGVSDRLIWRAEAANLFDVHDYNLYYSRTSGSGNWNLSTFKTYGYEAHASESDPLFADYASGDYRLQAGSPAISLGFAAGWLIGRPTQREMLSGGVEC